MFSKTSTSLISIGYSLLLTHPVMGQQALRQLNSCVANISLEFPIQSAFVEASYPFKDIIYHSVILYPPTLEQETYKAVISSQLNNCQTLIVYPSNLPIPITDSIPLSAARGLTVELVKAEIAAAGGVEQYQRFLNLALYDTGKLYLDPQHVWVLDQMGITLDPRIEVIDPTPEAYRP